MLLNHNYLTSVFTTLFLQFLQVPGRGHSVYYTFYCYLLMGYEVGVPDHLTSETCMQVRKQQLEPDMEQQTGSKLGKEYIIYRVLIRLERPDASLPFDLYHHQQR